MTIRAERDKELATWASALQAKEQRLWHPNDTRPDDFEGGRVRLRLRGGIEFRRRGNFVALGESTVHSAGPRSSRPPLRSEDPAGMLSEATTIDRLVRPLKESR